MSGGEDLVSEPPEAIDVVWSHDGFSATVKRVLAPPRWLTMTSLGVIMVTLSVQSLVMGLSWTWIAAVGVLTLATAAAVTLMLGAPIHIGVENGQLRRTSHAPIKLEAGFRLGELGTDYVAGMHVFDREDQTRGYVELVGTDIETRIWLKRTLQRYIDGLEPEEPIPERLEDIRRKQTAAKQSET